MATIKQGILGAFSGKVGGVVGSSWKGIPVMKSLPPSVSNPKTAAQIGQRLKMSTTVSIAKPILADVIKPLWDRFQSKQSGYNAFTQANIANVSAAGAITYSGIIISPNMNKAQLIDAIAAEVDITSKNVHVSAEGLSIAGTGKALATDLPYLVAINGRTRQSFVCVPETPYTRASFEYAASVPFNFTDESLQVGDTYHFYLAFLRADGTVPFATAYKSAISVEAE